MAKTRIRKARRARILDPMKALHEILRTSFKNDPKVLPALVLVWTLLLCHGLLGSVHQLSLDAGASAGSAGHPAHHMHEGPAPSGGAAGGEGASSFGGADYFAVALIVFAVAWSWWRSGRGRLVKRRAAYRRVFPTPFHVFRLLPRPRAPTLQVFRL